MNYYPVFLNLKGKKAVVIGGGRVAERKILLLVKADAVITVISPQLTGRLLKEKEKKRIRHISRSYKINDLKGAFIVIAATDSPEINSRVAKDAPALVNVVDVPSQCNFIAPSVVKRGPLTIAISTGGISPALSKTIRRELEKLYGPMFSEYLKFVKKLREKAMVEIKDKKQREKFLKSLASEKVLKTLRAKGFEGVEKIVDVIT